MGAALWRMALHLFDTFAALHEGKCSAQDLCATNGRKDQNACVGSKAEAEEENLRDAFDRVRCGPFITSVRAIVTRRSRIIPASDNGLC